MNFSSLRLFTCGAVFILMTWAADAQQTTNELLAHTLAATNADAAWMEFGKLSHPPQTPKAWESGEVAMKEKETFYKPYVYALADRAHDFYTRFPSNTNATMAKVQEFDLVKLLAGWGEATQKTRLQTIGQNLLKDPGMKTQDHYIVALELAEASPDDTKRAQLNAIVKAADAPDNIKKAANDALTKLDLMGSTPPIKFTAVDGRAVDLAAMKGKVVLVDFWATWCGPCVHEMPNVKKAYEDFHGKGFEIVGISLDKEKDRLTAFTKENTMPWPQYFDGLFWENKYARQFSIYSIPTMWLIDKKGKLRDMEAEGQLDSEIPKLLAE